MTSFKVTRRTLLGTLAGGLVAGSSLSVRADDAWPTRLVRLISPYGPGGSNDISHCDFERGRVNDASEICISARHD